MQVYLFTNCLQLKLNPRGEFFGQSNRAGLRFSQTGKTIVETSFNFRGHFSTIKITSSSIYKLN